MSTESKDREIPDDSAAPSWNAGVLRNLAGRLSRKNVTEWPVDMAKLLARYAVLSYEEPESIKYKIAAGRANNFKWFESVGGHCDTQAFACDIGNDLVVAFRGTQELRDFFTDARLKKKPLMSFTGEAPVVIGGMRVKVHGGFSDALDAIWSSKTKSYQRAAVARPTPTLGEYLSSIDAPERRIWLTGHSLGGALATVAAARMELSEGAPFKGRIAGLITFGSPRVLGHWGARHLVRGLTTDEGQSSIYRIYRTLDPVPAVPRFGYKHVSGSRSVVSHGGDLVVGARGSRRTMDGIGSFLQALEDTIGSALPGQRKGFTAFIAEHNKAGYHHAVEDWKQGNKLETIPLMSRIVVSSGKLGLSGGFGYSGATALVDTYMGKAVLAFVMQ